MQLRLETSYFCHLSRPSLVHHEVHSSLTEMHLSRQMTDNIFEIETTALAHVVCAPQESGVLVTDFAAAYPSVNHSWILSVIEKQNCPPFSVASCEIFTGTASHTWNSREENEGNSFNGQRSTTRLSCEWFPFCDGLLTQSCSKSQLSQGTSTIWSSCSLHTVLTLTILPLHHPLLEG